ncbi:MAG: stage III sporulation protein AF [Clostridium sp.]|nr:stage III sporulation protein AF [Clostridium sp.]
MIAVIKEICIFMIIAQGILLFVPGKTYVKYVRALVGIMMIMGITGPLFSLFMNEEKKREIQERAAELERSLTAESSRIEIPDNRLEIYSGIEKELAQRLAECESGYAVSGVELSEEKVVVTVREREAQEGEQGEIWIEPVTIEIGAEENGRAFGGEESGDISRGEKNKRASGEAENRGSSDKREHGNAPSGEKSENLPDEEYLKELYGTHLGVNAENIEIILQ